MLNDLFQDEDLADVDEEGRRRRWRERGAAVVEYAMLVALVSLACLLSIQLVSGEVNHTMMALSGELDPVTTTPSPPPPPPTTVTPTTAKPPCPKWKKC